MILYYTPGTCALGCMILLRRTGLDFSVCHVAREARHAEPYLSINPRGQVPAADVGGGRILTENSAILLHIAAKAGGSWLPSDASEARDRVHYWLSWLDSGFHVAFYPIFKPQLFLEDESLHADLRETAKLKVAQAYAMLDAHLGAHEWMLGDAPSLLDDYVFAMSRWGIRIFDGIDRWSHVHAHRERMLSDDAVKFGLGVESGDIVDADGAFQGQAPLA